MSSTYEIRLKKEFELLERLQRHPEVKKYLKIFYKERFTGGDYKLITEPILSIGQDGNQTQITMYPNKFRFTYTMPMYVGEGQLINDWSTSFTLEVPESVLLNPNKALDLKLDGGEFPEGRVPFNNHVTKTWVCTGTIWEIAQGCGLWYYVLSIGCLLNQDRIVTPANNSDEHRHLNSEAFHYWKVDREMKPITDIKWPFNLDSQVVIIGEGVNKQPKFVIGKTSQTQDVKEETPKPSFSIGATRSSQQEQQSEEIAPSFKIGITRKV